MYRTALRYVKSEVDTEDVLIMAFTKVFKYLDRYEDQGDGSLQAWIRKIVMNEALMWLRRRHNFNLTETADESLAVPDLSEFSDLPANDIQQFIAQLPIGYRTVFNLYVVEGFAHAEIASKLGISESTSRTQLLKAKTQLKKMLTQEGFHYGT